MVRRRRSWKGWGLGGLLALAPGSALAQRSVSAAERKVLDRVVAVVEGAVLTLSELEFETRVFLLERGGIQADAATLGEDTLREALELVISQRLQVLDADRLQAFQVDAADVEARVEGLRGRLGGEGAFQAFLARHDADLAQLRSVLERSARAERILDSRIRLRAQVSEAEVRRYYEAHAGDLSGNYEAVRTALQQKLARERYARLAAAELAQVREAAQVRLVAPFAREGGR